MSSPINTTGVPLVIDPRGKIETQISENPRFKEIKEPLEVIKKLGTQYKENEIGTLFRYSGAISDSGQFDAAYTGSLEMGDASTGLNAFGVSAILTQIATENPDTMTTLDPHAAWPQKKKYSAGFTPPLMVPNSQENLELFSKDLNVLFSQIKENASAPKVTYIPCRFENNGRVHWVLIAVEKQNDKITVTYINTRGGTHESKETAARTLINQEKVIEKAALENFQTEMVRNPDTPICLTTKCCAYDIIDIAERLNAQVTAGNNVADFVSQGGLLQKEDLASTNPEKADLNNRAKYAEKFIGFLHTAEKI